MGKTLTVAQIAELVGVPAQDRVADHLVVRVSEIEDADESAVVFAMDGGTLRAALGSAAGVILTRAKAVEGLGGVKAEDTRVMVVADPRLAFAVVGRRLASEVVGGVHPAAVVSSSAEIGAGSWIGPGAVVEDGVRIGAGCEIGPRVTVYAGVSIGDRVVVQAGAVLGARGFGYARNAETGEYVLFPQQGALVIEDDVEIGAGTTIDRGALGETRIGRGTKIDNLVHIGHNCRIGRNVIIAAQTGISGSSVVEDGAILGGQVGIGEHATVGAGVILGGGAGVLTGKKMHGPGEVFWGRPARPLKEYLRDLARLKRR
jgi:UDP-3-O-[3-hydroxymyristoyl] glucosamine N-acyltransferase